MTMTLSINEVLRRYTSQFHQMLAEDLSKHASSVDVRPRQLSVMLWVDAHPGRMQAEIEDGTGIDRSTLAEVLRLLTRKEWVRRKRCSDDARAYEVHLTAEGKRVLALARPCLIRAERAMLDRHPELRAVLAAERTRATSHMAAE